MIAFIPISRFRVAYDVAMGRPYSRLEALVLRAVGEGASSVDELQSTFRVHRRLLVEALVTLTQAGWVALGATGDQAFLLTTDGDEALRSGDAPRSRVVESRTSTVIMERITGACLSNDALRYISNRDIEDRGMKGLRLRTRIGVNRLNDSDVADLLPRRQGEWIHWIGPIDQDSKLNHWLPVSVDVSNYGIVGLPEEWDHRLGKEIVEEAKQFAPTLKAEERDVMLGGVEGRGARVDTEAPHVPKVEWSVSIEEGDLLFNQKDHVALLRTVFSEAETSLFIASAFLTLQCAQFLKGDLLRALQRGVNVDLMWGYSAGIDDAKREASSWLSDLASATKASGAKGVLRLNQVASQSHAKVLLWDGPCGVEACIGSFNWLSASAVDSSLTATGDEVTNISLRIREPAVVSRICRRAASLWDTVRFEVLSSTGDRWRQVASDLEGSATTTRPVPISAANACISLVADRAHEDVLRSALADAQQRLFVSSHKLGVTAETRLIAASNRPRAAGFSFAVRFGESTVEPVVVSRIDQLVRNSGGDLKAVRGLHAKVLMSDDRVCISSYNFLSADPYGTAKDSREIGVVVVGSEPCSWIANRLARL